MMIDGCAANKIKKIKHETPDTISKRATNEKETKNPTFSERRFNEG